MRAWPSAAGSPLGGVPAGVHDPRGRAVDVATSPPWPSRSPRSTSSKYMKYAGSNPPTSSNARGAAAGTTRTASRPRAPPVRRRPAGTPASTGSSATTSRTARARRRGRSTAAAARTGRRRPSGVGDQRADRARRAGADRAAASMRRWSPAPSTTSGFTTSTQSMAGSQRCHAGVGGARRSRGSRRFATSRTPGQRCRGRLDAAVRGTVVGEHHDDRPGRRRRQR